MSSEAHEHNSMECKVGQGIIYFIWRTRGAGAHGT
jgi:hypothetical protein